MKPASVILYGTTKPPENASRMHHLIVSGRPVYVRAEPFDGDCEEALANANPREGETVLNTLDFD